VVLKVHPAFEINFNEQLVRLNWCMSLYCIYLLFVALVLKRFVSYFVYEMLPLCLCLATIKGFS
jgi:hypothetical protein